MKKYFHLIFTVMLFAASARAEEGWRDLFNGRDLSLKTGMEKRLEIEGSR